MTYAGALAIETELSENIDDFTLGLVLIVTNLGVLVLVIFMSAQRFKQALKLTPPALTSQELFIINATMHGRDPNSPSGDGDGFELSSKIKEHKMPHHNSLLLQHAV